MRSHPTACENQREVAVDHCRCASILKAAGRYDEADERYALALAAARACGDKGLEGTTLQHQGILAVDRRQFHHAANLYQQALQRFQAADDQGAMMRTYTLLGTVEDNEGRLPEARAWYEKSRQLAVKLNDQRSLGAAAQNIGIVLQREGEVAREQGDEPTARLKFQAALSSVEESLRITQALGNKPDEASAYSQLASIHLRLGDLDAADFHVHEARQIFEDFGLKDVYKTYHILSEIAEARGDSAATAEWTRKRDAKIEELKRLAGGSGGLPR